jgi:DNA repair exonuclease SbcCD ATPase subunit
MANSVEASVFVSPYGKVRVEWYDRPENYSTEAKNRIKAHFAKKYSLNKNNVTVSYTAVKKASNGDLIQITGANIDNIMDINYQRSLMKEWLKRENKNIDFERLVKLDNKINGELNISDTEKQHTSWAVRWLMVDNFLSFGPENFLSFSKLRGLTIVNSNPSNQGGKTSLTIDALKFLFHGNTTKTEKNEQIFNQYSGKNELVVRGMIDIGGEETIIERKIKRSAKRAGGWTVNSTVNYYRLLPDGTEELLNEADSKVTTKKLLDTVGSEEDFEMLVLATEYNLDDLIGLTPGESGKILTRLIGLEVLEKKEKIVRNMFNEFEKKKKSNDFDVVTLSTEIEEHEEAITNLQSVLEFQEEKLAEIKTKIENLLSENDALLNSKITVDVTINALNPSKLEADIETITTSGKGIAVKIQELDAKIAEIGNISFDEDQHFEKTKKRNRTDTELQLKRAEIARLERNIKDLIAGGICGECNRKLDNVDNTEHIDKHTASIAILKQETTNLVSIINELDFTLAELGLVKKKVDEKNRLDLDKARLEVEIGSLRNKIKEKKNDLNKYKLNQEAIEFNRATDAKVAIVKTNLEVENRARDGVFYKIEKIKQDITQNRTQILDKTNLIEIIKQEQEAEKIFKAYIDLVGKKGIGKLVLRSVLPIINSELYRLLEDVCDFEIEIFIDDKNDTQFHIIKDGVVKLLKSGSGLEKTISALSLRAVLGKVSTLPMPNFITFDEVLGKIANENIEKLKPLFDKLKGMYEIVLLITHSDLVKDWGDNVLTVVKNSSNISSIKLN